MTEWRHHTVGLVHVVVGKPGQAKVSDLGIVVLANKNIGSSEVSVNVLALLQKWHTTRYLQHISLYVQASV